MLTIIREAADTIGIVRPSLVIGSADQQVRQLLALAQREGKELARRHPWTVLQSEVTFTTTATEVQSNVLPSDFDRFLPGTLWNRTQSRRVVGPLGPERYQMLKASIAVSTWDAFRIRGSSFLMYPTPNAGETVAFEYISKNWCSTAAGDTTQSEWIADTDVGLLDEELMTLGLVWRFLKTKGLDYAESFRSYEDAVVRKMAEDGGYDMLDLNNANIPGVSDPYIPDGGWSID